MAPLAFLSSLSHYGAHLAPLWHALEPDERGPWFAPPSLLPELGRLGVPRSAVVQGRPRQAAMPCAVAAASDASLCGDRPVVLIEHGAGQAYDVSDSAYSGGPSRDNVALFLCPNEPSAARNRAAYPDTPSLVVGSGRLDALEHAAPASPEPSRSAALGGHWDCALVPETRWALPHFWAVYPLLVGAVPCVGHGHPRFRGAYGDRWRRLGIPHVERFDELPGRAWLYVCDNSSTMFEWAALGRPVLVLNAPWYRRHVDLWPRFWRWAGVGVNCDEPERLLAAVDLALEDPPAVAEQRAEAVEAVFPLRDGRAAERSADAVRETLGSLR